MLASFVLLGAVDIELQSPAFGLGMFVAGAALGLLASQIGNVNMSSVGEDQSSEVGGLQGVFQNLGSSLGTALIGSVLIGDARRRRSPPAWPRAPCPRTRRSSWPRRPSGGVAIVPAASVPDLAREAGLDDAEAAELERVYANSQIESLRVSLVALIVIALLSLFFSRGIPTEIAGRPEDEVPETDEGAEVTT